jgi:MMPL family
VVTSAAAIMAAVFSVFVTLPVVELKILGVGLAAAVLIDATVVRGVLLPATLALLGDRAWRLRRSPLRKAPAQLSHQSNGSSESLRAGVTCHHGVRGHRHGHRGQRQPASRDSRVGEA